MRRAAYLQGKRRETDQKRIVNPRHRRRRTPVMAGPVDVAFMGLAMDATVIGMALGFSHTCALFRLERWAVGGPMTTENLARATPTAGAIRTTRSRPV
jgi:hypothetical protein